MRNLVVGLVVLMIAGTAFGASSLQIIAPAMADDRLYNVGAALEAALADKWGGLLIERAPQL